ncbi:response regulator [bacterium]|nr:MAG: response regulator [bacterium]
MTESKYVFCIDDNDIDLFLFRTMAKKVNQDCKIETFESAIKALSFLKDADTTPPDVIFLDIKMPLMNGFEFLEECLNTFKLNPLKSDVYILTSSVDPLDIEKANSFEKVKGFISKPLTINFLKELI